MKPIALHDLSRFRSELMGIAMLIVMLFHVGINRHDTFWFCVNRCGNVGVDIFLFLSGIGLWYAWTKGQGARSKEQVKGALAPFYKRRFLRIYPAWLLFASLYYIPLYTEGHFTLWETVGNVLIGWRLWSGTVDEFWFIPMILVFYLVSPFYMMLITRHPSWRWMPVVAIVFCVFMTYFKPLNAAVGHLEILFSRVPIFLLGINAGTWVKEQRQLEPHALWVLLTVFVLSTAVCINFEDGLRGRFPLFMERMVYIPLSVSMMFLLCRLLDHAPRFVLTALAFVGTVSLELYLVHVNFVLKYLKPYELGFWLTVLIMTAISLILAYLAHRIIGFAIRPLEGGVSKTASSRVGNRQFPNRESAVPESGNGSSRVGKRHFSQQPLVVFDFDGTLTTRDTLIAFIRHACGNGAFLWGFLIHLPLLVVMKLGLFDNGQCKQRVFSHFFCGWSEERFSQCGRDFCARHRHLLRPEAVETRRQAQADGARVLIVSASINQWVQPFFPDVEVLGTQTEVVDGRLTGRFLTPNCYGAEKVRRVSEVIGRREDYYITAYGDSRGDRELLQWADEAHYKPFRSLHSSSLLHSYTPTLLHSYTP